MSPAQRRQMVDREHPSLSLVRQCALLGVNRSSIYYRPRAASAEDLSLMGEIDRQYLETPFYGSRRLKAWLATGKVCEPEAGAAADAHRGTAGHLPSTPHQPASAGATSLSLSSGKGQSYWPQPGVGADITYLPMARGSSTWWPLWTGTAGTWWLGGCPTPWRRTSVSRR